MELTINDHHDSLHSGKHQLADGEVHLNLVVLLIGHSDPLIPRSPGANSGGPSRPNRSLRYGPPANSSTPTLDKLIVQISPTFPTLKLPNVYLCPINSRLYRPLVAKNPQLRNVGSSIVVACIPWSFVPLLSLIRSPATMMADQ